MPEKLPFEEWRNLLYERMKKYQIGEEMPIPRVENNDVPEFLKQLNRFMKSSRNAKIRVKSYSTLQEQLQYT